MAASDASAPKTPATLELDDTVFETALTRKFAKRTAYVPHDPRKILCFIPGIVRRIHVKPGQKIRRGEHLLVLEAMKMENDISSPVDGTIKTIVATAGQMVTKGQILIELE
jgi:biotin carboxyl carrier protein